MQCVYLTIILLIGCVFGNIDNGGSANDDLTKLAAGHIPEEFAGRIPENAVEDVQNTLKEKCKKVSNSDEAYETAIKAKDKLEECVKSQVNVTELQQEIEDAKPTGDLDSVFGKYCRKTPVVIECVKEFLKSVDPCLEEQEKVSKTLLVDLTVSITDFLCYKDGDRIAMFIAEGGVDCLTEHQNGMQMCANQTILAKNISTEIPTVDSIPLLVIDKEKCADFIALQKCIVDELEKCKEPTPANIIESFFKFVRKHLCDHLSSPNSQSSMGDDDSGKSSSTSVQAGFTTSLLIGLSVYKLILSH